jgi:hypothetical protein
VAFDALYFIRTDLETKNSYIIADTAEDGGSRLGCEFSSRFIWNPASDLQFNFGGAVFVPALGDRWPDEDPRFGINLRVVFSL